MTKHLFIPDIQAKEGVPTEHLSWIGNYIVDKKPDVIIQIGDFADMPSLSSYDKGRRAFEGRRYKKDIKAAREAMNLLLAPLKAYNEKQRITKHAQYRPRMVLTLGNHEARIERAVDAQAELEDVIGYHDLPYEDWEVHDYLKPVVIDGVMYVHYLSNPMNGKPYGGTSLNQLNKVQHSFCVGHKQTLDVATYFTPLGKQTWGIIAGACLTPDHKVLTADLKYVELGSLVEGDELLSFEEFARAKKRSRRYKKGTVKKVKRANKEVFEVTLDSGKIFKVTSDHNWLIKTGSMYKWTTTNRLRKGTCVPKILPEWETLDTFDAGWLSGMYDGEGCIYNRPTTGGNSSQLTITQKEGPTLERIKSVLNSLIGLENTSHTRDKGDCTSLRIKGVPGILKVLGSIRPQRLLSKLNVNNLGSICCSDSNNDKVVSIRSIGNQEIVMVDIDSKTMIVEGYPHHNCYLHDEEYKGYQGNAHYRGVVMLNDVKDGTFSPWFIPLEYLRNRYEN